MSKRGLARHAAARDGIEPDIMKAIKAIGASVDQWSRKGAPDLVVGDRDRELELALDMLKKLQGIMVTEVLSGLHAPLNAHIAGVLDRLIWLIEPRVEQGRTMLIEVKMPGETLRDTQRTWHDSWAGQVGIAWSVEDALRIMGAIE